MRNSTVPIVLVLVSIIIIVPLSLKVISVIKEREELVILLVKSIEQADKSRTQTERAIAAAERAIVIIKGLKDACNLEENKS